MIKIGLERLLIQGAAKFEALDDADAIDLLVIANTIAIYCKMVGGISTFWYKDDDQVEHQIADMASVGVTDHGALTGLGDDDHPQYVLRSILTTNGDLFTRIAGVIARLGIGSAGQVLTVSGGLPAWATQAPSSASAWSVLSNGDPVTPELVWDSNGDVIMTELCSGALC